MARPHRPQRLAVDLLVASGVALGLGLGLACSPMAPQTPVGVSDAAPEPEPPRAAPPPGPAWSDFAAARSWPEAAPPMRALVHRRDGAHIHVRVDPAIPGALAAYRALSTETAMPEGSRIIAWHETSSGQALGGYLLQKRGGVWSPLQIDAQGSVMPNDGERDDSACMRCHDMAPTDHLFGTPHSSGSVETESIAPSSR